MLVAGQAEVLPSVAAVGGCQGFVVAPFLASAQQPVVVIGGKAQPLELTGKGIEAIDAIETIETIETIDTIGTIPATEATGPSPSASYAADFAAFHGALQQGTFQKLVLARCTEAPRPGGTRPTELFLRACHSYPRLFIALVHTPQSGTWLTATPEVLLECLPDEDGPHSHLWHTMALAGTMRLRPDEMGGEGQHLRWSAKNIQEQRLVATYIHDVLRRHADDVSEEGPRTVRAANLVHLRSDFTFPLSNNICTRVGRLLSDLHPTPAVCGLPKAEALRFIVEHEHAPRSYYSGFMGPVSPEGPGTHLFVTLRCMQLLAHRCRLYAGGGLLRESTVQKEWQETEAKLGTMRSILQA